MEVVGGCGGWRRWMEVMGGGGGWRQWVDVVGGGNSGDVSPDNALAHCSAAAS